MSLVIDPVNPLDNPTYDQIRDTGHIVADNATIDKSLGFQLAERDVVRAIPALALPGGRSYGQRAYALLAVASLSVFYLVRTGGRTASGHSETTTTGELRSQSVQVGIVQVRSDYHQTSGTASLNRTSEIAAADQFNFLRDEAIAILQELGADTTHITPSTGKRIPRFRAFLTDSRLIEREQRNQPETIEQKIAAVVGELPYVEE